MDIEYFEKLLKGNNAIRIDESTIIFNDFEVYNLITKKSKYYRGINELVDDNKAIKNKIIETKEFPTGYEGRGSSKLSGELGGGFDHAKERGKPIASKKLLNATLNFGTSKGNSVDKVLSRFQSKYANADKEYGVAVDDNGYVHEHMSGGTSSVGVTGGKGMTIIHNHPSGSNFSDSDLLAVASTQNKGVIATSSNARKKSTYRFEKTDKFKAKEFIKAVGNAKWDKSYSYDKGADWWLKKNQKTYGYKYTSSGVPKS